MNEKILLSSEILNLNNKQFSKETGCVVAVGSFDGIHLGHRCLIKAVNDAAKRLGVSSAIFTFNTDDNPKSAPLLAQKEKKLELLSDLGVDFCVSVPFSKLKELSAHAFAEDLLYNGLGARAIVCGYDFKFGKDRVGDVDFIRDLLSSKGVEVITPDACLQDGMPISSTFIRSLISNGNITMANYLLGRRFSFSAVIEKGNQLGRTISAPTINQAFPLDMCCPAYGVYAVEVKMQNGKSFGGVANVGFKPTVDGKKLLCETHIYNYSGDCYGETAEISFIGFLRPEQRFDSIEALKHQIAEDKITALAILEKENII